MTDRSICFRPLLSGVLVFASLACSKEAPKRTSTVPVVIASVVQASVPVLVSTNGVVEPLQGVAIQPQVTGVVTDVLFHEGQDVTAGQVLFHIDPRPFQAALDQALAKLASDRAQAQNAQRDAERYKALVQKDYVTKSQADQAEATATAQAATAKADEAAVENARLNLAYTTVRAPISGRTGSILVRKGNVAQAGGTTPLVTINQIHPILVRFSIPQSQLPSVQQYASKDKLSVQVTPAEGAGPSATGTLSFINNSVDSTTGTVLLKATFPNVDNTLWPGQYVAVQLQLFVQHNAMTVPSQAVLTGQQGTYVFTVNKDSTTQQRPVVVSRTLDTTVVIERGVSPGESVIIDGQSRLSPGAKVTVKKGTAS